MKKYKRAGFQGSYWLVGLALLGGLFACALTGLMVAVIPPGTLIRLFAFPMVMLLLVALWMMPKRREAPDGLLNIILLVLVSLINLWPPYIIFRFGGMPTVNPTKLAWLAFMVLASFSILSCQVPMARLVARCKAHRILVSAIAFLFAWRIISSATGIQPLAQIATLVSEIVSCYFIFFLVLAVLRDEKDVFRMLVVLVIVAIAQACLASYESVVKHTLFARFITLGADDSAVMLDSLRGIFRDGHYRAQGTFEHSMVLAEFLAMIVPLAAAVFLTRREVLLRWAGLGFIPLAVAMIGASRSRSGMAVLLIAVLLVGVLRLIPRENTGGGQRSFSLVMIMAMLLAPLLLGVGYVAMQEMTSLIAGRTQTEAGSTMARVLMMQRGMPLLAASPFFGYGNGMGAVKLGFFDGVRYNIDNFFLGLALDAGIPGLVAFAVIFIGAIVLGLKVYRKRVDSAGTVAGFIVISLIMLLVTKTVLSITSGFTLAYILIAAMIVLGETPDRDGATKLAGESNRGMGMELK
ncbi:hypothetical protein AAKU55_002393 [Oxalobacteraceae bacterium GrIS 1.11]